MPKDSFDVMSLLAALTIVVLGVCVFVVLGIPIIALLQALD